MKILYFIKYKYFLFLISITFLLINCGYKLYENENSNINCKIKYIIFHNLNTYDPLLTSTIKNELFNNNIFLLKKNNTSNIKIPLINIINIYENFNKLPIIKHGTFTKIQFILKINANIEMPNMQTIPINIFIQKSLLNDNSTPLERDSSMNILRIEMYQEAVQQMINEIQSKICSIPTIKN